MPIRGQATGASPTSSDQDQDDVTQQSTQSGEPLLTAHKSATLLDHPYGSVTLNHLSQDIRRVLQQFFTSRDTSETKVSSALYHVTGDFQADGNADIVGNLSAGNADIVGNLSAGNANITGNLSAGNASIVGNLSAGNAASAATPSYFIQRDANGRAQVTDPAVAADIATKNYVDSLSNTVLEALPSAPSANATYVISSGAGKYTVHIPVTSLISGNSTAWTLGITVNNSINAGSFIVGRTYEITAVGTTNFTLIGASANTIGVRFTASGVGTGSGTAKSVIIIPIASNANTPKILSGDLLFDVHIDGSGNVASMPWQISGSNSNGSYTQLADGTMICTFTSSTKSTTTSTLVSGAIYYTETASGFAFPATFVAAPIVTWTAQPATSNESFWCGPYTPASSSNSGGWILLGSSSSTSYGAYMQYTAIGRWK